MFVTWTYFPYRQAACPSACCSAHSYWKFKNTMKQCVICRLMVVHYLQFFLQLVTHFSILSSLYQKSSQSAQKKSPWAKLWKSFNGFDTKCIQWPHLSKFMNCLFISTPPSQLYLHSILDIIAYYCSEPNITLNVCKLYWHLLHLKIKTEKNNQSLFPF